jgi:hypothetical protein
LVAGGGVAFGGGVVRAACTGLGSIVGTGSGYRSTTRGGGGGGMSSGIAGSVAARAFAHAATGAVMSVTTRSWGITRTQD